MQKEPKKLDDLFKSQFSNLEEVAPIFVKKNIDNVLFKKNRFWYKTLSILLLLITFISCFTYLNSSNSDLIKDSVLIQNNSNSINKNNLSKEVNIKSYPQDSNDNFTKNSESEKNKLSKIVNKEKKITIKNSNTKFNNNLNIKSLNSNSFIKNTVVNDLSINKKTDKQYQTTLTENSESSFNITKQSQNSNSFIDEKVTFELSENDPKLSLINFSNSNIDANKTPEKEIILPPEIKITHYLIGINSGYNINQSSYLSPSLTETKFYKENHTEHNTLAHDFFINTILKNQIIIGSGFGIQKQSYSYNYNEIITTNITTTNIDSTSIFDYYVYNPNDSMGGNIPIDSVYYYEYDTTTIITSENTNKLHQGKTTAQYFNIPLNLGYVIELNKFMISLQANLRYNILYKSSGVTYSNNQITAFDKTNSIFKKSYFDFAIQGTIYYQVINKTYINFSAKYSPISSNTYQNLDINRKLNTLHFGVGLSYKF